MKNHHLMHFLNEFGLLLYMQVSIIKAIRKILPDSMKAPFYTLEQSCKKRKLKKIFAPVFSKMRESAETSIHGTEEIPPQIWVFWWQGNQNDIPLVKFCIDSIEKNKPYNTELIILTKENLNEYCTIDDTIKQKLHAGEITLTHFSDIVRVSVLAEQGGLWLDATIFAASDFSSVFRKGIWSIRKPDVKQKYIPKGRWRIYAIGAPKGSLLFILMRDMLNYYWGSHCVMLDYFLIDYCMDFLYDSVPEIRTLFDEIPENNPQVLALQKNLGKVFSPDIFATMTVDTQLFKLSWKVKIPLDVKGKETVLGWLFANFSR